MLGRMSAFSPDSVSRPVLQKPICTTSPRPNEGNQPRVTANTMMRRMPTKKGGSDVPTSEMVM